MTTTASHTTDGFRIRSADRADLLAIHRIERASFPQPWPFNTFEQFLDEPGFLVADDGSVLGFVVADVTETHAAPIGHVKDLAVREGRRREGIGTTLLESAMGVLEGRVGLVKLEVRESNERAIDLYEDEGFRYRRTIDSYYNNDEDALVLVREV